MRELIDSAVRLRNLKRTLAQRTDLTLHSRYLNLAITSMERYLNALLDEFKDRYKPIADKQRIYEASFSYGLLQDPPNRTPPPNSPWEEIRTLPRMAEFRQKRTSEVHQSDDYRQQFTDPLSLASWILTSELVNFSGKRVETNIPAAHSGTQQWLEDLSHTLALDRDE